ncbi:MAG: YdiU family protein [Candidatus Scalindua sp. AMX11]|nr:MAG: YdiU family protein [Candidatus Scalindua sp.]NOG85143.1 YdiU family protein [Planctomycetota bacterium]RZV67668.1 MAG: YdiU family protein [Candidatus Scalindua sp. SCAELEC01]TDE63703.1 MAG: YdiU family protein [Candidatus Scalindua sp. AMX11]
MNTQFKLQPLDTLTFDNSFTRELPSDPETTNNRRQVKQSCYSRVHPTKASRPQLVAYAREVAEELNITSSVCETEDFVQVFSGNRSLSGMDHYATCYGGHQFGTWAGQLGDGRVINLGEIVNKYGERRTLQLKGAGPTPYARMADGFAVLRSSVREFLCSEAMHHLGIPTTRALSLVTTGDQVVRDMLYDGNPKPEPGAVICRVAQSFTRFGSFQIFTARGETDVLQRLIDYTIRTDFPHLGEPSTEVYLRWFEEVCRRTAEMIVHWMRVGFVHGVMNTDNMSILGLTIDYGPYGWLEDYAPDWTPNTTDAGGRRYCFGNQPQISHWNLTQLAQAIYPLIEQQEPLHLALGRYAKEFEHGWQSMMAQKLGLNAFDPVTDVDLVTELQEILQLVETDMTIFYRQLAEVDISTEPLNDASDMKLLEPLMEAYYETDQLTRDMITRTGKWIRCYKARVQKDSTLNGSRRKRMNAVNPNYVLRNYLAQLAIEKAEQGDNSRINELLELLRRPYDEQPGKEEYAKKRPDWARHRAGCSMLSCSS